MHDEVLRFIINYQIFSSIYEFEEIFKNRKELYLKLIKSSDNYLNLSKGILSIIANGEVNVLYLPAIMQHFYDSSHIYEDFIDGYMKDRKIIE